MQGTIGLAMTFGRAPVAEGVETMAHAVELHQLCCDILQGYGFSRPLPKADFEHWVGSWVLPVELSQQGARAAL